MTTQNPILTNEEQNVLILTSVHPDSRHLSYSEISLRLGIPVAKVKSLIHRACEKLGADNRNEAVLIAISRGEIKLNQLLSLEELAEILNSVEPDVLRCIAEKVRQNPGSKKLFVLQ